MPPAAIAQTTTADADANNEIRWQTLFTSLLFLAFANMMQPSGRVCGQPSNLRFWLRSSPFISIMDSCTLLIQIVMMFIHCKDLETGAAAALEARFDDSPEGVSELKAMKEQWLFRWVFVLLPSLYGAVKWLGFQGIPCTKAICCGYLVSYILLEICYCLPDFGRRYRCSLEQNHPAQAVSLRECDASAALTHATMVQSACQLLAFHRLTFGIDGPWRFTSLVDLLALFILASSFSMLPYLCMNEYFGRSYPSGWRRTGFVVLVATSPPYIAWLTVVMLRQGLRDYGLILLEWVVSVVVSYCFALFLSSFESLTKHVWAGESRSGPHMFYVRVYLAIFLHGVAVTSCYYALRYDPSGTSKVWTDVLG